MSRFFLALDIGTQDRVRIKNWCLNTLAKQKIIKNFKAIPKNNYHITLAFLGSLTKQQYNFLVAQSSLISQQFIVPITNNSSDRVLTLDQLAWFKKPKVLYLTTCLPPRWLTTLAQHLTSTTIKLAIPMDDTPYIPHVSLYRKANQLVSEPSNINIRIHIKSFSLYLSKPSDDGVVYSAVKTWQI
mgnify:CR=1 FL=1